ncbi:MAG TPA: GntR family transcriptional regulator [Candidatus Stackebrandtia excrementipullorum]|nr:GntR family transcriptional regulator [Candidatus Stackebrandtia excrementipullorum]
MVTPHERRGKPSQTSRVQSLVVDRIMSGRYPVGTKLPSSRELAAELNTNHSAVGSAYKELTELGIVSIVWGKGTFVARRPREANGQDLSEVESRLEQVLRDALSSGLSHSQLAALVRRNLDRVLRDNTPRVAVVECNEHDIDRCVRAVEDRLHVRATGVLLSEVMAEADSALERFDLVTVTYFHLEQLLNTVSGGHDRIAGINYVPTPKSTATLAGLPKGTKVVIACTPGQGTRSYPGLAHMYGCEVVGSWSPDRPESELMSLVADGARVLSSVAAAEAITALKLDVDPLVVGFHVDGSSLAELAGRVEQLGTDLVVHSTGAPRPRQPDGGGPS